MSGAISNFIQATPSNTSSTGSSLKYNYIWQNLDQLFVQINDQADINDLNQKFLSLAFEKLNKKSES